MRSMLAIAFALALTGGAGAYWYLHREPFLTDQDTLVLANFSNSTGEAVFDGSLREALGIALLQSPYLNVVSPEKVSETMRLIGHSGDEPLTASLAQMVCQKAGAKAYLSGAVAKAGAGYLVSLEGSRCDSGGSALKTRSEAANREAVLRALSAAASEWRKDAGESEESIQRFNMPLDRATSPSLEALKSYAEGRKATREKGSLEGIAPLQKAVSLDARFALAYSSLAVNHYNLNQNALASEEIRQAFEMGDRQTAREHVQITTLYYDLGTGDVQKAIESYKDWERLYPRDDVARGNLSSEYFLIGDYEQAAQTAKEALQLEPDSLAWYENLSTAYIALMRLDEAQATLNEAFAKKLEDPSLHANLYALDFLREDTDGMQRELASAMGKPSGEDTMLALQADTEAFYGHQKKARELSRRAVESAQKSELAEPAAIWAALAALREAAFGNMPEARKGAAEVAKIAPSSRDAQILAALVLARAGDGPRAQALAEDLRAKYVSNTLVQAAWIPAIQAQTEILAQRPQRAVELLQGVKPYERGELIGNLSNCCMVPVYLRGEAYLRAGQGTQALSEFEKILDNRGVVVNCWAGALARLGQARAKAMAGYSAAAKVAYQQFFALWKDADSDIPILKAARAEYTKLK
ncbi:MAG TPA: tetratricopeptide repeat protein [Candidatus Methylomirabilis sp.]|nr:tetratricopeptide repeat protein [Candidatus Methylomirabilis sp.]